MTASPRLDRIAVATISAPDVGATSAAYAAWLGYEVVERGVVAPSLASGWSAPAMAGRRYHLLRPENGVDVYLRIVEIDARDDFVPMRSYGWTAIEIVVADVHDLAARLEVSPFVRIGDPKPLQGYPTIIAMQVRGPAGEVLYLTMESGDAATSLLPRPDGAVGRPFIAVVAGPDVVLLRDGYARAFGMAPRPISMVPVDILQQAQDLPADHAFPLTILQLAEHGNLIELDGYSPDGSAGARAATPGQLPPGIAMHSFTINDLDIAGLADLGPVHRADGLAYAGARSAVWRGPAGELVELIERPGKSPE